MAPMHRLGPDWRSAAFTPLQLAKKVRSKDRSMPQSEILDGVNAALPA
jgi:hypothetical protein